MSFTSESDGYALDLSAEDSEHVLARYFSRRMEQFGKHGF